jgi:hypothetical protein
MKKVSLLSIIDFFLKISSWTLGEKSPSGEISRSSSSKSDDEDARMSEKLIILNNLIKCKHELELAAIFEAACR